MYPFLLFTVTLYQLLLFPVTFTFVPRFAVVNLAYDVDGPFLTFTEVGRTIYSSDAKGVNTFSVKYLDEI